MIAASFIAALIALAVGTLGDIAGYQPTSIHVALVLIVVSAALYLAGGAPAAERSS
jgi:hypothetical protein